MAIAHVICDARKLREAGSADFMQRFIRCDDFDDTAIMQRQFIAVGEHGADLDLYTDFLATR